LIFGVLFSYKSWWIASIALGLCFTFSTVTIFKIKNHINIQREMRYHWAKVGDVLEERILIQNNSLVPVPAMEIQDHTNIPDHLFAIGSNVEAHGQTIWRTRHICSRRGLYRIGPTTVQISDLFGMYELKIHDPTETNILITPPVVPLPNIDVASGGQTGVGKMSKGVLEQSVAVSTIRDYHPQDPLHHIHWPLSAKHGALTTRVFENTPTGNWWIIQDMNRDVQFSEGKQNSIETGIILSASMAGKGLQSGKAVGFVANDCLSSWIPPQNASDQNLKILRTLALSEPGNISCKDLLKNSRDSFQQAASLIIITPDISLDWWDSLLWLKAKGMIPTVILLKPEQVREDHAINNALNQLQDAGIRGYAVGAEMFADQLDVKETPLWEWRVFGTG
jgi:uncharacterized protein (DUF58 family)